MEMEEGTEGVRATVSWQPRLIALRTEYESATIPPVRTIILLLNCSGAAQHIILCLPPAH